MIYLSPSKINLHLGVTGRLPNGYHTIETLFMEIPWYDEIDIEVCSKGPIKVTTSIDLCKMEENLCYKAAKLLKENSNLDCGCSIHLNKNIPTGAGLGGGSANCAVVLKALNSLWKLNYSEEELENLGVKLGADVPFFIKGGTSVARGVGDKLTTVKNNLSDIYILIIYKNIHVSTSWAYKNLNISLTEEKKSSIFDTVALRGLDMADLGSFGNDFEKVVFQKHRELKEIIELLDSEGSIFSRMSGSGSSIFGFFKDENKVFSLEERFRGEGCLTKVVKF
ncbi:MAG: 4-(cytidine 5'-diphospho)-2-C-methyl-D-erythritol kinase [Candidatus Cloacimonadota bacterium]|nr:MAG: 4-(cytidine 5'-diphospho)-2-C-methyl-D-erythritol kinase [Candidatus Cloacimonadota bacterium]PIE79193.1 MAG: 4-(cytidine 5'-diphospho)-2-C-methyl-D-erythritol kinase [Candidatus Delongbacteria bacterium]